MPSVWLPPNVSIDPIIEAGHRATGGDRRCDEAATRDSENARPRYAYCGNGVRRGCFRSGAAERGCREKPLDDVVMAGYADGGDGS
jgi:hypothetical protein